jgi:hypothetical protein
MRSLTLLLAFVLVFLSCSAWWWRGRTQPAADLHRKPQSHSVRDKDIVACFPTTKERLELAYAARAWHHGAIRTLVGVNDTELANKLNKNCKSSSWKMCKLPLQPGFAHCSIRLVFFLAWCTTCRLPRCAYNCAAQ